MTLQHIYDTEYHKIEKILTEFKNGATYSDSIEKMQEVNSRITKAIVEMADNYIEENRHKVERIDRYVLDDFRHFLQDLIK